MDDFLLRDHREQHNQQRWPSGHVRPRFHPSAASRIISRLPLLVLYCLWTFLHEIEPHGSCRQRRALLDNTKEAYHIHVVEMHIQSAQLQNNRSNEHQNITQWCSIIQYVLQMQFISVTLAREKDAWCQLNSQLSVSKEDIFDYFVMKISITASPRQPYVSFEEISCQDFLRYRHAFNCAVSVHRMRDMFRAYYIKALSPLSMRRLGGNTASPLRTWLSQSEKTCHTHCTIRSSLRLGTQSTNLLPSNPSKLADDCNLRQRRLRLQERQVKSERQSKFMGICI